METGTRIGKYEIVGSIGRGGMVDVYKARDTEFGRVVALKLLPPEFARDPERVARFMKEVRNSADITHPNVVQVYDVGEGDGFYFYTMAYLPGGDLKERIKSGMPEDAALTLLRQTADALGAAHAKGIVHRDVKPENIMFDEAGRPILTDLGIAGAVTGGTCMTKTGMSIGTPHYMSSEQARGKTVDARSDIYSLGVVFFEMLTGTVPFDVEDTFAVSYIHINDPVPALPAHLLKYQPLIKGMLAKDPDHRYRDCKALEQDISRLEQGQKPLGTGSRSRSVMPKPAACRGAGAPKAIMLGALAALVAAACVYFYMEKNRGVIPRGGGSVQAPPPQLLGSLAVTTTPEGAIVTLDGTAKGRSPLEIADLTPGSRTVRAALKDHMDQSVRVQITGGSRSRVHFDLKAVIRSGHLTVIPTPAESRVRILNIKPVYADGIELGPGRYHIEVFHSGYQAKTQWVRVDAGEEVQVAVVLEKIKQARLFIHTNPGYCSIRFLDGRSFSNGMSLPFGSYSLEISKNGYRSVKHTVDLNTFSDKTISLELKKSGPIPGLSWTEPVTGIEFVWVPGGCYQMGDTFDVGDSDEKPVHQVCVNGFWFGKYEVTQDQWKKIMGSNPSRFKGGSRPVEQVSWNDCRKFIRKLSSRSGKSFRLPYEAEWEYAARSGGINEKYAGGSDVGRVAWYRTNSGKHTYDVGTKAPNGLGIYDMSGNVWEWCKDWYGKNYYKNSPRDNPYGPSSGSFRVLRGGSWYFNQRYVWAADRSRSWPDDCFYDLGFRLVLSPSQ